jgi:hypothetical protein
VESSGDVPEEFAGIPMWYDCEMRRDSHFLPNASDSFLVFRIFLKKTVSLLSPKLLSNLSFKSQ